MQISTVNVNGIRAAVKQRSEENRGMLQWLRTAGSDIVLMQEVRATEKQAIDALQPAIDEGWHYACAPAAAKGRAGVGILSREPLEEIHVGIPGFEDAGRYLEARVGTTVVASLYLPSGAAGDPKQDEKYEFLDSFEEFLQSRHDQRMVIGGDWNICHREQDLKNFKTNRKKSGFLPDERAFMDSLLGTFPDAQSQISEHGTWEGALEYRSDRKREPASDPRWFDIARRLNPEETAYTWWTYRGKAFDTDAGWRIDYQIATRPMLEAAQRSWVDKADAYDLRWSDHSPLQVTYDC
ncbi:MAG: exodeoxyribonuclease III [Corynebacterium sp.]|nr:exodeoxyribonuclease III [Corynebacterium sp.]